MRWLIVSILVCAGLWAQGEKPKQPETAAQAVRPGSALAAISDQKKTADEQYLWIIQTYDQAKRDRYDKSIQRALQAIDYFTETYPQDERLPTAYFYSEQLHSLAGNTAQQEGALKKYFSVATSSNPVYLLARLDQAGLWERAGQITEAVQEYEAVYAVATENTQEKDEALLRLIPSYESTQQVEKLKVVYAFFINNPEKLANKEMYYIYAYKLGVIYYEEGNKKEAAKYFAIVQSGTAPVLRLFKESIETKYK